MCTGGVHKAMFSCACVGSFRECIPFLVVISSTKGQEARCPKVPTRPGYITTLRAPLISSPPTCLRTAHATLRNPTHGSLGSFLPLLRHWPCRSRRRLSCRTLLLLCRRALWLSLKRACGLPLWSTLANHPELGVHLVEVQL